MKDTMQNLTKLPKSTLLPALGLLFFVFVAVAGVYIAQYQQLNRGPVTPNAPGLSQAGGNVCTTSWIAQALATPTPPASSVPSPSPSPTPPPTPSPTPRVSPSPTPSIECEDCNFQVDAIWGTVINDFSKPYVGQSNSAPHARYSVNPNGSGQGSRLIGAVSDEANPQFPGCQNLQASGVNPMPPRLNSTCRNPVGRGFLTKGDITIDRVTNTARVTITNTTGNCTYDVGLVSYKANWSQGFEVQELNDSETASLPPGQSASFEVELPMNNDGPQCHSGGGTAECPAYPPLSTALFSEFPDHHVWYPQNPDGDQITYLGEFPVNYAYTTWIIEEMDDGVPYAPPDNIVFHQEYGELTQGQTLTFNYPDAGQWGNPDVYGAYEIHTSIDFEYIDSTGQSCSTLGHNWDRWYHDTSANLVVKNNNLVTTNTFSVMANGEVLRNRDGSPMTYTLKPRQQVDIQAGLPAGATSVQLKSTSGAFQVRDVVITNNQTGQVTFDLARQSSLKSKGTATFGN